MRYLPLLLLTSCLHAQEPIIDRHLPAMVYVKPSEYLPDYDEIVVISAPDRTGTIHTAKGQTGVRYRTIKHGVVRFHQGEVTLEYITDDIVWYIEVKHEMRWVGIDSLAYPQVWLSGEPYDYSEFIFQHGPPSASVGDSIWVVTEEGRLEAIR